MPIFPTALFDSSRPSDNDNATFPLPLSNASFTLDSSGLAGFFGGDSSVAGMATVNLVPNRRWFGWYNTPGSYEIAKRYGPLSGMKLCDGLFPDGEHDPALLFGIDGKEGPQFIGMHSGTNFQRTGHLARLITSHAAALPLTRKRFTTDVGRITMCPPVIIAKLPTVPKEIDVREPTSWQHSAYLSLVPILVSVGGCVVCALVADWFSFASIAVGIIAHGLACLVIGSGKLVFEHPKPAKDTPPGDGVVKGDDALVILVGEEGAVNALTRGRFRLQYREELSGDRTTLTSLNGADEGPTQIKVFPGQARSVIPHQSLIGPCALLLMGQFLVQLLLIPLGTLFGQLMFIATVVASWVYNIHLSSIDRQRIQTDILFDVLKLRSTDENPKMMKYWLNTWTSTVAFICFVLASVHRLDDPRVFLDAMIPNNTTVWRAWKASMSEELTKEGFNPKNPDSPFSLHKDDSVADEQHGVLLDTLFRDSKDAWRAWCEVHVEVLKAVEISDQPGLRNGPNEPSST